MGMATSLNALAAVIDPSQAYWSVLMKSNKVWSEHSLIPTLQKGKAGFRLLDWGDDIVSTGDVHRVKEIRMHCPNGKTAVLEIGDGNEPFQFKTRSMEMLGGWGNGLEYMVIGRVLDKSTGACESFIWDYKPEPGQNNLIAYKSSIRDFGGWRSTVMPLGALSIDVQGFRL